MIGPHGKAGPLAVMLLVMAAMFSGCQSGQDHAAQATPPTDSAAGGAAPVVAPPETTKEDLRPAPPPPMPPAIPPTPTNTAALRPLPAIRHLTKPRPATGAEIVTGSGTGAGASAAQGEDDETILEKALAQLKTGTLAYSTPERMKMVETAHIVAKIASDAVSAEALKAQMPQDAGTNIEMAATAITPKMKMTLAGADFTITPLSSEEQMVVGTVPTTWAWDIVPKHAGKLRLHLAAVIELNGMVKDFTTVDRDIAVQVDAADMVGDFVRGNWQWLVATLTALVGGLWKFLHARKKGAAKEE